MSGDATAPSPTFDRREEPTPEHVWCAAPQWEHAPILDLAALGQHWRQVVVASAHPDDETLGVGALLADLATLGLDLTVVVATAGERSHQLSDPVARHRLALRRRREVEQAVDRLAPGAAVVHLDYPDTGLHHSVRSLATDLREHIDPGSLLLAPWVRDGHGDHDACGRAARLVAESTGVATAYYPVWMWHWSTPATLPWDDVVVVESSAAAAHRKRDALAAFTSQTTAWDGDPGRDDPDAVVDAATVDRAGRLVETLFDPGRCLPQRQQPTRMSTRRAAVFDAMYEADPDAWSTTGSFYETRRRDLVLAVLARAWYPRALEVGCADGHLTAALTARVGHLQALDISSAAVEHAERAAPEARFIIGAAPGDMPAGPFELVVLSEIGYFLTPVEWLVTLQRAQASLTPDGELLLCHWQHPTVDIPLDGRLVHEQARRALPGPPRMRYADADLCIESWGGAVSVAEREGRQGVGRSG